MSNGFTKALTIIIAVIAVAAIIDNHLKKLEIARLKRELEENENLTEEIKKRLKELVTNSDHVDPLVAEELKQIAELIEIKQETKAILSLAKIIENLLKELYKENIEDVKNIAKLHGRKRPVFADYLEHAKNKQVISNEEYHLISLLKIIRNEEAHDLGVKKEKSRLIACFTAGLGIVFALSSLLKLKGNTKITL
jgi:hypothetical protein